MSDPVLDHLLDRIMKLCDRLTALEYEQSTARDDDPIREVQIWAIGEELTRLGEHYNRRIREQL